jgi:hypothetical protein
VWPVAAVGNALTGIGVGTATAECPEGYLVLGGGLLLGNGKLVTSSSRRRRLTRRREQVSASNASRVDGGCRAGDSLQRTVRLRLRR